MIDVKTAFLLWVIQAGTLAILLFAIWLHARDQRHFLWFGLGFLLQAVGLGMVGLRDQIPAVISIHVGNTLSLLGFVCWGQALCAFDGRRVPAYVALPAAIWVGGNAVPMLTAELGYRMAIYNTAAAAGLVALAAITLTGTFSTRRYRGMLGTVWFLQAGACLVFAYMATRIMPRSFTEMTLAVAVSIVGLIAFVTAMTLIAKMMMDRSEERLQALVRADPLTGALNRRGFSDAFEQLVGTAPSAAIAMIIFDLDHFKQVNDRHGHHVGDRVLLEFSATCRAHLPQRAAFGRTGGEEFAAVLAVNEPKDAALFAETVRMAFAEREIDAETQRIHATTSVGIAVAPLATANLETMMAQADTALYAAKAEGRNRTSVKTGAHVVTVPPAHSDSLDAQADRQVAVLKRIAAVGNKLHD